MAEPGRPAAGDSGPQARALDGLEHLQTAARELIAAARAMLDVVEDVVTDPESVTALAGFVGGLLRQGAGGRDEGDDREAGRRDDGEIQRITVR